MIASSSALVFFQFHEYQRDWSGFNQLQYMKVELEHVLLARGDQDFATQQAINNPAERSTFDQSLPERHHRHEHPIHHKYRQWIWPVTPHHLGPPITIYLMVEDGKWISSRHLAGLLV
jgi:hypothetical protein